MKRQSEGADSSSKRVHTESIFKSNYELTRRAIKSKDMALWSTILANKDVYWPNDDVLRDHLEYAIKQESSQIAIDLINTKVNLKDYFCSDGDDIDTKSYISAILLSTKNVNDRSNLIAALLDNGYDINARYEDFSKTALLYAMGNGSDPVSHSELLILNGAKFKHSYEQVVDGQTHIRETVRLVFDSVNNDYDVREVRVVRDILSSTIMAHYNNPQQVAEVNSAIELASGQHFDREGGDEEPEVDMLETLDAQECVTRSTIIDQIRKGISNSDACIESLTRCVYNKLNTPKKHEIFQTLLNLELDADFPLLEALNHAWRPEWSWKSTVFHSFGWNSVAEAKTAIAQNPQAAQQIAERCIARLEEQHKAQQPGL